jgi:hypothetical protein
MHSVSQHRSRLSTIYADPEDTMSAFNQGLWRKCCLLVVMLLVAASVTPVPALAAASTSTVIETIPLAYSLFVPCVAGGAGEYVDLAGWSHYVFSVTIDDQGGAHLFANELQQLTGTGETTGAIYRGSGEMREAYNMSVGFQQTDIGDAMMISQGPGNNFKVHENFHLTVNADGTVTVTMDNFRVTCS